MFSSFILLTLGSAITEGLGVGLLIPLLQQGGKIQDTGGQIPWLDKAAVLMGGASPSERMFKVVVVLAIVIIARGILQMAASYISIRLPARVQFKLSTFVYDTTLAAGLPFLAQADGGVLRTLIQEYPQRLASSIKSITDSIAGVMLIAIYIAVMVLVSWQMTLVAMLLVGLSGFAIKQSLTLPLARTGEALSTWQERWNTQIYETGVGLKLIRLLGAEKLMSDRNRLYTRNYFRYEVIRQMIGEAQSPIMTTFGGLFVCGMLLYGTTASQNIEPAHLLVLVLCLYRLMAPGSRLLTNFVVISTNLDALHRQENFLAASESSRLPNGEKIFHQLHSGLSLSGVKFTYPGSDRPALDGVDLDIARGQMVAIVGPSGAGKTSIVNLVGRLYEPDSGYLKVDGVDLSAYQIATWRRKIAIVSQDTTLFNMSVAENVTFGLEGITQSDLENAARRAAAFDFINDLPNGWNTRLGDRGARLSGGQQQRLSIVRAILRDPQLLILDEATSQLDSITEQTIQEFIEDSRGKVTILVVAHRLSTIRRADRIAVMQNGAVVEFAPHDELASGQTRYRAMLDAQQLDLAAEAAN